MPSPCHDQTMTASYSESRKTHTTPMPSLAFSLLGTEGAPHFTARLIERRVGALPWTRLGIWGLFSHRMRMATRRQQSHLSLKTSQDFFGQVLNFYNVIPLCTRTSSPVSASSPQDTRTAPTPVNYIYLVTLLELYIWSHYLN